MAEVVVVEQVALVLLNVIACSKDFDSMLDFMLNILTSMSNNVAAAIANDQLLGYENTSNVMLLARVKCWEK